MCSCRERGRMALEGAGVECGEWSKLKRGKTRIAVKQATREH